MANQITMDDLQSILQTLPPGSLVVDVRTHEEFAEGHVPGARNIPVDVIHNYANELKKHSNLYLYCRSGGRVGAATEILESLGVSNLQSVFSGGFPNWAARGFEIEFN